MKYFIQIILAGLIFSSLNLVGCGKKAALYLPSVDKGEAQSDQSFVFPPEREKPDETK